MTVEQYIKENGTTERISISEDTRPIVDKGGAYYEPFFIGTAQEIPPEVLNRTVKDAFIAFMWNNTTIILEGEEMAAINEIKELQGELEKLNSTIASILKRCNYIYDNELSELEYDAADKDEIFIKEQIADIMRQLDIINGDIDYLSKPIKSEGNLQKGEYGRYYLNEIELCSGSSIEYLCPEDICTINGEWITGYKWRLSRVEHNGSDYYIIGYDGKLDGLKARKR